MGPALSDKDVNAPVQVQDAAAGNKDSKSTGIKSLEYHRQVLQSKMEEEKYGAKDTNTNTTSSTATTSTSTDAAPRVQNPQSRLLANVTASDDRQQQYISPSDNIMSPCTAKLNAFKGRAAGR